MTTLATVTFWWNWYCWIFIFPMPSMNMEVVGDGAHKSQLQYPVRQSLSVGLLDFYASGLPEVPSPGTDYCEYVRGTDWSMCSQSCGWGQSLRYRDKRCKPDVRHCQIRPCDYQQSHYKRVRYHWYYRPTLRIVNHAGLALYSWLVWGLRLWRAELGGRALVSEILLILIGIVCSQNCSIC